MPTKIKHLKINKIQPQEKYLDISQSTITHLKICLLQYKQICWAVICSRILPNKPKMAYRCDLPKMARLECSVAIMNYHEISWTIMDNYGLEIDLYGVARQFAH